MPGWEAAIPDRLLASPPASGRLWRSLRAALRSATLKIALMLAMFAAVPMLVYDQLLAAAADNDRLLADSISAQGRMAAEALRPWLDKADNDTMQRVSEAVGRLGAAGPDIKLLFRPLGEGVAFFYIASAPTVPGEYLERERQELLRMGVLDKLNDSCEAVRSSGLRFTNPDGVTELLTSITPVLSSAGCWVVITADRSPEALASSLGQPYWTTAAVRTAAAIYIAMALAVTVLVLQIWLGLRRFEQLARSLRAGGGGEAMSFRALNRIPELAGIAGEFDRLVVALRASADALRFAAHETAHAFKTPLAIIAQSLEPLRRRVEGDARGERSCELIGKALERLDGLVSAARRLDETLADTINPPRVRINLSDLVRDITGEYAEAHDPARLRIAREIEPGCIIVGAAALMEIVLQNLIDNAISFTPAGGVVSVTLRAHQRAVELCVSDQGPGVEPEGLDSIFDRYVSLRAGTTEKVTAQAPESPKGHFGIGLWIVRRNVEAMGGVVAAANNPDGGLRVVVALPLAA